MYNIMVGTCLSEGYCGDTAVTGSHVPLCLVTLPFTHCSLSTDPLCLPPHPLSVSCHKSINYT